MNSKFKANKQKPPTTVGPNLLDITVSISGLDFRPPPWTPRPKATIPAGMPKEVVKTFPLCICHIPKALVNAIKNPDLGESFRCELNPKKRISLRRLARLNSRANPASRHKALDDGFVTLPVRWQLVFHNNA
jgi:hypothetical protein